MRFGLEPFLKTTRLPVIIHSQAYASQDNLDALAQIDGLALGMRDTAYALKTLSDYGAFLTKWKAQETDGGDDARQPPVSSSVCCQLLSQGRTADLLKAYGIPLPPQSLAVSKAQAVQAAREMGYPVALKISSVDVPHKTDIGALVLNMRDDAGVEQAYDQIMANVARAVPQARIDGMQVQKMMPAALEMVVGITRDADFGPLLMVGLGGVFVELMRDVAFSPVPVSPEQAEDLIRSLKGFPLLEGLRGAKPGDVRGLATLASNLSRLAADHPGAVEEIDINPVLVYEDSVCAVDYLVIPGVALSNSAKKGH